MSKLKKDFDEFLNSLSSKDSLTNVYGLARSLLAFGTFLTILFNDPMTLMHPGSASVNPSSVTLLQHLNYFNLFSVKDYNLLKYLCLFILLTVISGWRPRITGILHWWISLSFINSALVIEGGDQITSNLTFLLLPITLMDDRKWHWNLVEDFNSKVKIRNLISNIMFFLIRLQMAILYFHSAVGKLPNKEWQNGTAIYYWFIHPIFGLNTWLRPILLPLASNSFVVVVLTWGTILFEILLFMCLTLNQRFRYHFLWLGILFHFLIALVFGLISFSIAMDAGLILYLYPVDKQIHFNKYLVTFKNFHFFTIKN